MAAQNDNEFIAAASLAVLEAELAQAQAAYSTFASEGLRLYIEQLHAAIETLSRMAS